MRLLKRIWAWIKSLFTSGVDEPIPDQPSKKIALLFAIDDYPGEVNDLAECINDQNKVIARLTNYFSKFIIRPFKNSEVTVSKFKKELRDAVSSLTWGDVLVVHYSGHGTQVPDTDGDEGDGYDEALYLYDGVLVDDDIRDILEKIPNGALVYIILDSCFSGTATKSIRGQKVRFIPPPGGVRQKARKRFSEVHYNHILMTGCNNLQYCYDGVYTPALMRVLDPTDTNLIWHKEASRAVITYPQTPQLNADPWVLDRIVFTP